MAKTCANHPKDQATSACHQCHKNLCRSCIMVTPAGTFCSSECSVIFREMKSMGEKKKSSGFGTKLVLFVLVVAVLAVGGAYLFARGSSYDILSPLLRKFGG